MTFAIAKVSEHGLLAKLSNISEIATDIQRVAGKTNLVADCLSRVVVGAVHLGLDYAH